MPSKAYQRRIADVVQGDCRDPFAILGMHQAEAGKIVVRAFLPGATEVAVIDAASERVLVSLAKEHEAGFFAAPIPRRRKAFPYRLRVDYGDVDHRDVDQGDGADGDGSHGGTRVEMDDPYRFPSTLGETDLYLLAEGTHLDNYRKLGAHPTTIEGVTGVVFAVWAPNAKRVSVVGGFNHWDGRHHPMRLHPGCGVWELFIPGLERGTLYKFDIKDAEGNLQPQKADPYAFRGEKPPRNASVVEGLGAYAWNDSPWMERRGGANDRHAPIAVYEVHLGSWKRVSAEGERFLDYGELADQLIPYVKAMGFTHVELLPVSEFPFDGSWGYQPISLYAPTSRFGSPDDFRHFVDRCHQEGLGVILDWAAAHFPEDDHGLVRFDGTHLYEHEDPRLGRHMDWGTLIYNFGRREVCNFLLANALFWLDQFHVDGLRVDAVASMLYLDYSREEGEWLPNEYGGNENIEAVAFLKRLNELVYARHPGAIMIAEESTSWPMVSRPTDMGGLGFGFKWNMGWMHDTLRYMAQDPIHRKHHHKDLTFGLLYAYHENFMLPLSHDEVVHGKKSILGRMPGDAWQRFANLRLCYTMMYAYPGKKLLFMGNEFGQEREWNHDRGLDWHLVDDPAHRGISDLVRDLNHLYREHPALHRLDCEGDGFSWIDFSDVDRSIISFLRRGGDEDPIVVVVANFTPTTHHHYRIGVPQPGRYEEILNSDAQRYAGSNTGNIGETVAEAIPAHGHPCSISLSLPPLGALIFCRKDTP